jgi:enoyl-CoA hydratase/carnithine racemase
MPAVEVQAFGHVARLRMTMPARGNVLTTPEMLGAMRDALHTIAGEPALRVLVLTGTGTVFSAGGDIDDIAQARGMFAGDPATLRDNYRDGIHRLVAAVYNLDKVTIAAINGAAVGAGFDLSLACDLRIAARTARLRTGFSALGLVPGDGGAWLLLNAVGPAIAARLLFTSEMVDAARALSLGLVSDVVAEDALDAAALELAQAIAAHPAPALRLTKRLLRRAATQSFSEALEDAAAAQALCHHTPEHRALAAQLAKARRRRRP